MNIGGLHLAEDDANPRRVVDLHFRVDGPAVLQMEEVFLEDWHFPTGDAAPVSPPPAPATAGDVYCRGISDGPNHDFETLRWIIAGAITAAKHRIRIMTPYFIPDWPLLSALTAAALRGVQIDLLLPQRNNLPYVAWATRAFLWELLQHGIRVWYQPPPFVHTKLLLIDSGWGLVGSSNLDPRSLRLNFEFNLEIYDHAVVSELERLADAARGRSRPVTLEEIDGRSLPIRLRDATAKLFSPYL
jgi:cardiolipin synthase